MTIWMVGRGRRVVESDPAAVGVQDDLEVSFVDDDMMVVPAEDDELVLVGRAALCPGGEMVDLEPVAALASVPGTGEPRLGE